MADTKPTTSWAVASLVLSLLGAGAHLALVALLETYGEIANRSAGVGIIWMGLYGLLATALCLVGILLGTVALVRIRNGKSIGRGMACTGIVLGCLPLVLLVILLMSGDANTLRK